MSPITPQHALTEALRAFRAGDLGRAASIARRELSRQPKNADAMAMLGMIEQERGEYDAAAAWHRKSIVANRREPTYLCNLASTLLPRGRFTDALACYEKALRLDPENEQAIAGVADILDLRGRTGRARRMLEPRARKRRLTSRMAQIYARILQREGQHKEAIDLLKRHLDRSNVPPDHRRALWLLLARSYERLRDIDAAFDAMCEASRAVDRTFDPSLREERFQSLRSIFSRTALSTMPRAANTSDLPVFIVGMPRSGSTLLEQIIHAHPEAHGAGEIPDLVLRVRELPVLLNTDETYPFCARSITTDALDRTANAYLDALPGHNRKVRRISDKMLTNYERLGMIELLFPNARIIHISRNPVDTCLSCFARNLSPSRHPYVTRLEWLGAAYRSYERLMEHWHSVLSVPVLEIEYESIVENPADEARRIIDFLDLEWNDACLLPHATKRDVTTLSHDQVRQPIHRRALGRAARYGARLDPLRTALGLPPWKSGAAE